MLEYFHCLLDMFLIGNETQDFAIIIVKLYITIKADLHLKYFFLCVASKTDSLMNSIITCLENEY